MSSNNIDLSSLEFLADPYPTYHRLREANAPFWLAFSGPTGGMEFMADFALLRHPSQLALLKNQPELLPAAVEEMLRFESPVQRATFRLTTETLEIGGTTIEKGGRSAPSSARPIATPANSHDRIPLTSLGSPTATLPLAWASTSAWERLWRAEARIGFGRLLEQLPNLQLVNQAPDWSANTFFRGLRTLPVTF